MQKQYISHFGEKFVIPAHLSFSVNIGDVIMLNGLHQLITGFGIYDNQMWTEKVYEDGCHLGAANYENITNAVVVTDESTRRNVINAYKNATLEHFERFKEMMSRYISLDVIEMHLKQFE